ncbi:MAG: hypothetical protein D6775_15060 [Caldilineae bacterium]|nr:MAG: hypothetical protein D6775_15060 [Caldilineae bacterium]
MMRTHSHRDTTAGATWYAGDFHAHTTASDGRHTPAELARLAQAAGLDFLSITDHNTLAGFDALGEPLPLPIVRGIEVTLAGGHFNILGIEGVPPWLASLQQQRVRTTGSGQRESERPTLSEIMKSSRASGWLVSINHPLLVPWAWEHLELPLDQIDCLEIWNDPTWPDNATANPATVDMWSRWLNAGHRIVALGGSDYHYTITEQGPYHPAIDLPRTWVLAERLSAGAILEGVRHGRVYVSMEPGIAFQAHLGDHTYTIGDDMGRARGRVTFQADVRSGCAEIEIVIIRDGQPLCRQLSGRGESRLSCHDELDGSRAWYRCDVRDGNGTILAVTNPIFAGAWPPPATHTFRDFLPGTGSD